MMAPFMSQAIKPAAMDEEVIKCDVPAAVVSKLLGDGNWVKTVSQRTGARIHVQHRADGSACLEMIGQPEQVIDAESMAEDAVKAATDAAGMEAAVAAATGAPAVASAAPAPAPAAAGLAGFAP